MDSVIFFLFLVYFRLNNEGIWEDFFRTTAPSQYKIYIHTSLPSKFIPPSKLRFTLVPTVHSAYYHLVEPMNQLLKFSLNESVDQHDRFIFLSENTIPVKPFRFLAQHYLTTMDSEFCITPTNQWLLLNRSSDKEYSVKHHQWITLNRPNATSIVNAIRSTNNGSLDVLGRIIPRPLGHSEEEFWHHLFLYSRFNANNQSTAVRFSTNNQSTTLRFPSHVEQGSCVTYVYWPNYHPMSLFRTDIDMLKATDVDGQHIIRAPLSFLIQLRHSTSFFFIRKLVDTGNDTFLPPRMRKRNFQGFYNDTTTTSMSPSPHGTLLSLREAIEQLKVYAI